MRQDSHRMSQSQSQSHEPQPAREPMIPPAAGLCGGLPLVEELSPAPDPWEAASRFPDYPFFLFLDSATTDSRGGAAGRFGYGLCHHVERVPPARRDEFRVPDMAIGLYDWVWPCDRQAGRAWLVATGFPRRLEAGRQWAAARLRWAREVLKMP